MANYFVDSTRPDDTGAGTSEATAKQTLAAGFALLSAAGDILYIKASGTYTITSTLSPTAALKGSLTNGRIRVEGYTTTPGARDGRPTITSATNSVHLITLNDNDFFEFVHLKFTHTAGTRGAAFTCVTSSSTPVWFDDLVVDGCLSFMNASLSSTWYITASEVMNTTSTSQAVSVPVIGTLYLYGCDIHDNAGDGVRSGVNTGALIAQDCIIDTNAGIGINFTATAQGHTCELYGCLVIDNGGSGVKFAATSNANGVTLALVDNVFLNNGGYGIENLDEQAIADASVRVNRSNAFGSGGQANTSGTYTGISGGLNELSVTADPFTNRAGRDFTPNNTAGGGAVLRSAAFPTAFPGGTTTSHRDVGAVQHQDAGGGSGVVGHGLTGSLLLG